VALPVGTLSFRQLTNILKTMWVPTELTPLPGWMTYQEQRALYVLAYLLDGPFLEIGAWVGKSTSIIAKAIRDAGYHKRFVTSELNPTLKHFRPVGNGIGFFITPESEECLGVATMKSWKEEMEPVISGPGGVVGALRENLANLGLDHLVDIRVGDCMSVPRLEYQLIFSDVMHTPAEIRTNLSSLQEIIGGRGCVLAAHDWSPQNERFIREVFPVVDSTLYDTLFICQLAPEHGQSTIG
jgi:hypothetical protein